LPILFIYFLWYWGLNSGPTPWVTPPALFLWWVFFKIGSHELFVGLASNHGSLDLCLPSS
jgi:hypothetical protein